LQPFSLFQGLDLTSIQLQWWEFLFRNGQSLSCH